MSLPMPSMNFSCAKEAHGKGDAGTYQKMGGKKEGAGSKRTEGFVE